MNKETYQKFIKEDIELINTYVPEGVERSHIIEIINDSVNHYYPSVSQRKDICVRCGKQNDNDGSICYECIEEIQNLP